MATRELTFKLKVDRSELDDAIEKANRLVELLREAEALIDSLSGAEKSDV